MTRRPVLVEGFRALEAQLRARSAELQRLHPGRLGLAALAARIAWGVAQDVNRFGEPYDTAFQNRDEAMAENVEWLLREAFPGKKAILWAHNAHVQYRPGMMSGGEHRIPMGQRLRARHGRALYTLGLFMGHGRTGNTDGTASEITPLAPRSVEALLDAVPGGAVFTDLRAYPKGAWPNRTLTGKYWGIGDSPFVPRAHFDGLLYLRNVHSSRPLKSTEALAGSRLPRPWR